jgi:hypothetical protein
MTSRFSPGLCLQLFALLLLGLSSTPGWAIKDIHVVALFKDRVAVMIDGKRHILGTGETSPEGVKLVSADSVGAVFEFKGERLERQLDGRVRAAVKKRDTGEDVLVFRDSSFVSGRYRSQFGGYELRTGAPPGHRFSRRG